jgi:hypothetical protein
MIFTSKKKKTAKAIKSATKDIVSDKLLAKECGDLIADEQAASYLCTEVMLQRIHVLVFIVNKKFHHNYEWATWDFVTENIGYGIEEGLGNKSLLPVIINGLFRLMNIEGAGPDRLQKVYQSSAKLVLQYDSHLSEDDIIKFIQKQVESFTMTLGKYL